MASTLPCGGMGAGRFCLQNRALNSPESQEIRPKEPSQQVQEENLTACATREFLPAPRILKSAANYKTHEAVLKEWQRLDPLLSPICRDFGLDFKLCRLARELERLTNTESQTSCITQCRDLSFPSLIIQQPHLSRKKIIMKAYLALY